MFAVLLSDINSLKSGLVHLTSQPYCKKSRSAKVKDGIINLILRNNLFDRCNCFSSKILKNSNLYFTLCTFVFQFFIVSLEKSQFKLACNKSMFYPCYQHPLHCSICPEPRKSKQFTCFGLEGESFITSAPVQCHKSLFSSSVMSQQKRPGINVIKLVSFIADKEAK